MACSDLLQPVYVRDFTEQTGPAVPVPSSPLQVFRLFFTPAILEYIVTETNRYARLDMGEERYRKWDIITTEDLVAYFGIMIVMEWYDYLHCRLLETRSSVPMYHHF